MKMESKLDNLSFVILREEGNLAARCLQKNIAILGDSLSDVRENVDSFVEGSNDPDLKRVIEELPRASENYWDLYQEACEKGNFLDEYLANLINLELPMAYQVS